MKKTSIVLAFTLCVVSMKALASTTIDCNGNNKSLQVSFDYNQSGSIQAPVKFGDTDSMASLSQKIQVEVTIMPIGTYYSDKEVRSYRGYYLADDLKIGFAISQTFDRNNKMVLELKNIFGVNQLPVGKCLVMQSE
ncbi:MAG: hypothetical protein B7Y39_11095 [Bdellovibrio sp. 28-41-41]|nr:MAG: hypothetical protein B7Y39_11095 [Bdellovibrio sp. 28-41-41]